MRSILTENLISLKVDPDDFRPYPVREIVGEIAENTDLPPVVGFGSARYFHQIQAERMSH